MVNLNALIVAESIVLKKAFTCTLEVVINKRDKYIVVMFVKVQYYKSQLTSMRICM